MNELEEKSLTAGKTVYEEGGPGDAVFIVTDGKVEVTRRIGDEHVRLAVLSKGAIFGESGVLRNTARSTTVRTITPATLMVIPKEAFLSVFKRENPLALTLLRALCDRLATAQSQLMVHQLYSEGAPYRAVRSIRLLAESPEMLTHIGTEGMVIETLPFHVGRHLRPEEKTTVRKADLMVQASHGDEISPLHFAIENQEGRLIVRDLGSHLGTLVAGQRIGHFEEFSAADLSYGTTSIQAGGLESPYRFQIVVERALGKAAD
jgi:CRP-like cAMP-binding protein